MKMSTFLKILLCVGALSIFCLELCESNQREAALSGNWRENGLFKSFQNQRAKRDLPDETLRKAWREMPGSDDSANLTNSLEVQSSGPGTSTSLQANRLTGVLDSFERFIKNIIIQILDLCISVLNVGVTILNNVIDTIKRVEASINKF